MIYILLIALVVVTAQSLYLFRRVKKLENIIIKNKRNRKRTSTTTKRVRARSCSSK